MLPKKTILVKTNEHPLQDRIEERMELARLRSLELERKEIRRLNRKLGR